MDPINESTTKSIYAMIQSQKLGSDFTFESSLLGPTGECVEKWGITGSIKAVDFGELNYDKSDFIEILMLIEVKDVKLLY
jgi:hypothetical protein